MSDAKDIQNRLSALRDSVEGKTDSRAAAENVIDRIDTILKDDQAEIAAENSPPESSFQDNLANVISDTGKATYEGSRIVRAFIKTAIWTWEKFLLPVVRYTIAPIAYWVIRKYTKLYNWLAYTKDEKTGKERIHYPRSLATIIGSFVIGYWLLTSAIPFLSHLAYEAILYPTTLRKETMIMMGSEADAIQPGVFYAKGCSDLSHCDDTHSIRYEIRTSNWVYLKTLFTKGQLFLPEFVDGAIPNVVAKCELETWGIRFRPLALYPQISSVKRCVPLSDDEIQSLTGFSQPR